MAPPDSLENDTFGREVALYGDWAFASSFDDEVCIGKPLFDPSRPNSCVSGAVFAFQRQGNGDWEFQQKIAPEELEQFDYFGTNAIAVEGKYAVIGSRGDDDACPDPPPPQPLFCDTGAAFLFELMDDAWVKVDKFTASDADSLDFLGGTIFSQGRPIGISGSHIAAGAPTVSLGENPAPAFGSAYIFKFLNQDPVAQDDEAAAEAGMPVIIDVLANDSDPDADALSVSIATQATGGTAEANADGTITYMPRDDFSGPDSLMYTAIDEDGGTATATVSLEVTAPAGTAVEPPQGVATVVRLYANYPNPFSPTTEVAFDLPQPAHVRLAVFDVLGRPVETLVDRPMPAGHHAVVFEAGDVPSGLYVYRLEAGPKTLTKTMLLLK